MDYTIISGNLNTFGDQGRFETDRSTWGFGNILNAWTFERSALQAFAGNYSCRMTITGTGPFDIIFGARGRINIQANRKYLARCRVFVPSSAPCCPDDYVIKMRVFTGTDSDPFHFQYRTILEETGVTVAEATDNWQIVETIFSTDNTVPGFVERQVAVTFTTSGMATPFFLGRAFFDELQIFEIIENVNTCDLAIDQENTVIVNETSEGSADGSITVAVTGGDAPFEYSKNGGSTWQTSNVFAGLTQGVYAIVVRELGNPTCSAAQSFAVNLSTQDFDFTMAITNESVLGAADGSIEVTVTGTLAPFQYSKDGGATYQGSNIFTGLAAGTYTIVVKDANDIIRAKNATVGAGLTIYDAVYLSKNPITYLTTAPNTWIAEENYYQFVDVRVEDVAGSGIFNSKMKLRLVPDANNQARFVLNRALAGSLKATPPAYNDTQIRRLTDRIKLYRVFRGSISGSQQEPSSYTASNPFLVLLGGLDKNTFPTTDYLTNYLPVNKKFMTWAPVIKEVDLQQEDYLNFWVYSIATTQIKLQVRVYFDDDTDVTQVVRTASVQYSNLYQVPAGPLNLNITTIDPEKNVVKYELTLLDQNDIAISETREYQIVLPKPYQKYVLFLNSLGAFEVLRFTGIAEQSAGYTSNINENFLPHNYDRLRGQFERGQVIRQPKANYSTGFYNGPMAEQWFNYLYDFIGSRQVYVTKGTQRRPLVITSNEMQGKTDGNFQYFVRFEAVSAFNEESYTPEVI